MTTRTCETSCSRITAPGVRPLGFVWLLLVTTAAADDLVTHTGPGGRGPATQVAGQIVEYTGRQLEIEVSGGIRRKFNADQVVDVQTDCKPDHVAADALYAKQDYAAALAKYQPALTADTRRWVRRRILAQMVRCYRAQGALAQAGENFLLLLKDDPDAVDFDAIPLAWLPGDAAAVAEAKANEWLARDDLPAAALLGASHLLQSPRSATATQKLQTLVNQRDVRIAWLAEAQLLRGSIATIDEAELRRWADKITRFPQKLRAGAYYTLGRAWFQRQQPESAALYLLRAPILYPHDHPLAAESLLLAAEALNKANQQSDAQRLVRELAASYPQSRAAKEARSRAADWGLEN